MYSRKREKIIKNSENNKQIAGNNLACLFGTQWHMRYLPCIKILQQIFHCFCYLAIFERIQVDLGGGKVGMSERFGDEGNVYARPFEYGCVGMAGHIGC